MQVAVIDYNAGNIQSVLFALERLGCVGKLTQNETEILAADRVIFPGVGSATSSMKYLLETGLAQTILKVSKPFLGICLGLQLMCQYSEEGETEGLGLFDLQVKKFKSSLKVPHMGWNTCNFSGKLFEGLSSSDYFYFVHSYYAELGDGSAGVCEYGLQFSAAIERDNFFAVQFHPEKSAKAGERILKNFLLVES